jgi:hypothetical protein
MATAAEARLKIVKEERANTLAELNKVREKIMAYESRLKPAIPSPPPIIKQSEADEQLNEYPIEGDGSDSDSLNF